MERFLSIPLIVHFLLGFTLPISSTLVSAFAKIDSSLYQCALFIHIAFMFYWILYPYAICTTLITRVKPKIELPYNWFLFNWIVTFLGLMLLIIASYLFQQDEFHVQGWPAFIVIYFFYALIFTFLFTARILKTIEKEEHVGYGESTGAALALAFFPVSFLLMHKRVLKALDKPILRSDLAVD